MYVCLSLCVYVCMEVSPPGLPVWKVVVQSCCAPERKLFHERMQRVYKCNFQMIILQGLSTEGMSIGRNSLGANF